MAGNPFYKDHWINIDLGRLDRYERMFQWSPASATLYEPVDIRPGHIVADFGSGPGHTAIEIAKWVGRNGHVHALDINSEPTPLSAPLARLSGRASEGGSEGMGSTGAHDQFAELDAHNKHTSRGITARSRNARLAAIRSFFNFATMD